jgi:hypothetical protein
VALLHRVLPRRFANERFVGSRAMSEEQLESLNPPGTRCPGELASKQRDGACIGDDSALGTESVSKQKF